MSRLPIVVTLLSLATAAMTAAPARADVVPAFSTFEFAGQCSDCTGTALGELILQNYTLGDQIGDTNFVSFSYGGTNLFSPYTVTAADLPLLFGSIGADLPGPETVAISDDSVQFLSSTDGSWCTSTAFSCIPAADTGLTHRWTSAAAAASPVPEPMTLGLLGGGLVGLAALRRKR